jgi:NitT/TauT family transport system ATP-binding protein
MLELSGVERTFSDGTAAVRDLDLRVRRGEFVTVVGPSGCGKSTLLRLVSGLEPTTAGTVDVAPCRLGYVFQDPTLLPWRTVTRNVELLAELEGIPRGERRRRVERVLDLVGLTGFEQARPAASREECGCARRSRGHWCSSRSCSSSTNRSARWTS